MTQDEWEQHARAVLIVRGVAPLTAARLVEDMARAALEHAAEVGFDSEDWSEIGLGVGEVH